MISFFIGLAIFTLVGMVFKPKVKIIGIIPILLFCGTCWGLGRLVLLLLGRG